MTRLIPHLGLALIAVVAYANALHNPFVFDDRTEILENPSIVSLSDVSTIVRHSLTRPVTNASYAVDYALWGLDPYGYHLTNVILHVLNVLLLYGLVHRLVNDFELTGDPPGRAPLVAFAASGFFAAHPMMTEAVGYVSGRAEVLASTFFLASLLALRSTLIASRWRSGAALAVGLFLLLLAVGTKEIAVMLPAVLLAYDLQATRTSGAAPRPCQWRLHAPLLLAILALAAARVWFYVAREHPDAAGLDWRNVLVELHVLERYMALLVMPVSQSIVSPVYPFSSFWDVRLVTAAAVLGGTLTLAVTVRRRQPLVTFGLTWFFLVLLPSTVLILLARKGQPMAEHRVYLSSCGFFMASAALLSHLLYARVADVRRRRVTAVAVLALLIGVLSTLTIIRNRTWSDPVRLWADAARKAPRTWMAHYGLADAQRAAADCESAMVSYRRAIALSPDNVEGYLGFAECAAELGRFGDARQSLRQAIAVAPEDPRPSQALATLDGLSAPAGKLR